jgi:hypothetical protein
VARRSGYKAAVAWATPNGATPGVSLSSTSTAGPGRGLGAVVQPGGKASGVRVIALDQPGMGPSDFQPRRAVVDWPADVGQMHRLRIP